MQTYYERYTAKLREEQIFLLKKANGKTGTKQQFKLAERKRCAQFNEAVKTNEMKRCMYENARLKKTKVLVGSLLNDLLFAFHSRQNKRISRTK